MIEAKVTNIAKRPFGFWGFILRLINIILIIVLVLSYFAQWVSPEYFWPIAFFGIAYPILALLNFLFVAYWLFRRRKFFLYSLLALLMGVSLIGRFFQIGSNVEVADDVSSFKVLSYNVHVFDQYHHHYGKDNQARDAIIDFLIEQDADIYCLQEFYDNNKKKDQHNIKLLKKKLGTPYVFKAPYSSRSDRLYNVILSKKPIKSAEIIERVDGDRNICGIYADIEIENKRIRVYSIHLKSFQISNEAHVFNLDYNLNTQEGQEAVKENSLRMAKKFKRAFTIRSKQIRAVKNHLESSEYPIIIAGDFNDTPSSYAYGQLIEDMGDAFKENGHGFGTTYNGPLPNFRIDYILFDSSFANHSFNTWPIKYSDHYPVSAVFSIQNSLN